MPLTSRDETDLLLPLFGMGDTVEPFTPFLERLRRRTDSSYAGLLVRVGSGGEHRFYAGADIPKLAGDLNLEGLHLIDTIQQDRLRLGRVYGTDEFDAHDPGLKAQSARAMRKLDLADGRIVRVLKDDLASAWLITASAHPCSAADSALLSNLLPYVAAAVRRFLLDKQHQLAASLDATGLQRAGNGWIAFDRLSRIVAMAPATTQALKTALGHEPRIGQRLRECGPAVERELLEAAAQFSTWPDAAGRTLILLKNPRIEAVMVGIEEQERGSVVMVAHCRHPRAPGESRGEHFARLHALPRREAELAILLADGWSLADAGQSLGLTIETTRNYSKRLFAKVGVRGQAELVRAVYESCAMLA